MPLSNPFRRAADRPSLRERAADLKAGLSRAIHQPSPETVAPADQPPVTFTDQVSQAGRMGDVLAASGIDHRDGTVSYADATGKVVRRPMSYWIGFNAQQMHGRIQAEIGRRSAIEANHLPYEGRVAWDAAIRCELRSDAVHALAFRHVRAFEAEQAFRSGIEPATRKAGDAELLALAPLYEGAVDLYQQRIDEQEEIEIAAPSDGWPGQAPEGSGSQWQAWFRQKEDWRERTGVAAAEEATRDAGTALHQIELRVAALPAASLAGLKFKARVAQRSDDIEIEWPDGLGAGLARDILAFVETAPVGRPDLTKPDALTAAILDGWKAWGATPNEPDEAWNRAIEQRDRLLYAAMALPATPENITAKALACAWMEWVETERPGQPRDAYGPADRLVYDLHTAIMARGAPENPQPATAQPRGIDLVSRIDFAAATMNELRHIRSIAEHIGSTAYAHHQGARCEGGRNAFGFRLDNDLGKLMVSLGDALTEVESAADAEARRRMPSVEGDRQTRLLMLAPAAIDNDEPDEIEAFALELLAYAAAERARG